MKKRVKMLLACLGLLAAFTACGEEQKTETELRTVSTVDIDSLNPYQVVSSASDQLLMNVFEGLVMPSPEGGIHPALAESYEISPNGLDYTFHIRKGVVFHNGNPMDVKDVEYSLKKMAGKFGDTPTEALFANIESIDVLDEDSIRIHLKEADSSFIYYLKEAIVPDENQDSLDQKAIGTGPYKIADYQKEQKLIFEKNEDYWGEKAILPKVSIFISPNTETNFLKLLAGEINFLTEVDSKRIPELQNYKIVAAPRNLSMILALNNEISPFTDVEVRKAINLALDKEKIIRIAVDGQGQALFTNMSPVMKKFLYDGKVEPANPELAKEILAKKGLSDLSFTIKVPNNAKIYLDVAQAIQEQLTAIGLDVKLESIEWASWLSDVYTNRKYEASLAGLSGKMEPDAILRRYTSSYPKNFMNFKNADYDALVAAAKKEASEAKQIEDYKKAEKILTDEQAAVFIMDPDSIIAMDAKIAGYQKYPLPYLNFARLHFEK